MNTTLCYDLKRAEHASRTAADERLAPLGLNAPQFGAMVMLDETPGLSSAELARRCFVTPQTINGMVQGLERRGLLVRGAHPTHGRILETFLTAEGRAVLEQAREVMLALDVQMTADLTAAEEEQLRELLYRCIDAVERRDKASGVVASV